MDIKSFANDEAKRRLREDIKELFPECTWQSIAAQIANRTKLSKQ